MDGVHPPQGKKPDSGDRFPEQGKIDRLKEQMYSRATQPVSRPRRELSGVERTTRTDWAAQEPTGKPKKSTRSMLLGALPKTNSIPSMLLIIAVLLFVVAGAVAASFILSGSNVVSARNIGIAINGPRTISGGEILELQIAVTNSNSATLELADLVVTYPQGARTEASPNTTVDEQRIPLGAIEPGETRNGTVRAIVFGRNGETQNISVALEYRLSGSSALFFAEEFHPVLVSSGVLDIALQTNSQVVAGQRLDMTVLVTSQAKTPIADVLLHATYPFGFAEEDTSPKAVEEGIWELGTLEPGETREIRILGLLDGQTGDTRAFRFLAGTRESPNKNAIETVLAEFEHVINVTRPFLAMSLEFDNQEAQEYVAHTGKPLTVRLNWRNNLDTALSDVVVAATLSGRGLDPFNVTVDRGFYRSIDSVVLWDKTTTKGELGQVPAGAEGTLTLRLVPATSDKLVGVEEPVIRLELHAAAQRLAEESVPETIQATVTEEIKLATDTEFRGSALYFENPLGSVGPLPPQVENETTYGILWELANTTSAVRNGRLTATLPPYVRWLGVVSPSVENVTFNENDGTVTWNVGTLLPNTGVGTTPPRRVVFSIGLVPSTSQVGSSPAIILNQTFRGLNTFVDESVEESISDLTTKLGEADFADIYGTVIE